jgi:hypothetical protein
VPLLLLSAHGASPKAGVAATGGPAAGGTGDLRHEAVALLLQSRQQDPAELRCRVTEATAAWGSSVLR